MRLFSFLLAVLFLAPCGFTDAIAHAAEVRVTTRDELVQALRAAQAGTSIQLAPGNYRGGISQVNLRGTAEQPIVIAAEDATHPPVIEGGSFAFQFSSPEHLELRDLIISGQTDNGLNIDDSGSTDTPARQIALRNVVVRDIGPDGNRDGVKLSGVYGLVIDGCTIETWGSGGSAIDMVGCHDGTIEHCKFQRARGGDANSVQTKGGSSEITIRRCRFENAGGRAVNAGGSTGLPFFRPLDAAYEAKNIVIEDCEFIGSDAAIAFVGVDGAIAQHNTIYRPRRWAIRILQENIDARFAPCRNVQFSKNLIVFRSDELRQAANIGGDTDPDSFTLSGNVWYCMDRPNDTQRIVRHPLKETDATYDRDPRLADPEKGDLSAPGRHETDAGVRPLEATKGR